MTNVKVRLASCRRWLKKDEDKPEQSLKEYLEGTHTRMPVLSPDDLLDIPSMQLILDNEVLNITTVSDLDAMNSKWRNAKTQFDEFVAGCKAACGDVKRYSTAKTNKKKKEQDKAAKDKEKQEQDASKAVTKGKAKKASGGSRWELTAEKLASIEGIEKLEEKITSANVNWATPWFSLPELAASLMADAKVKETINDFASSCRKNPDFNKTRRLMAKTMSGKGKEEVDKLFKQVGPENIDLAAIDGASFLENTWLVGVGEKMEYIDWNTTGAGQIRILADGGQVFLVMLETDGLLEALDKKGITLTFDGLKEYFMQGTLDKLTAMAEDSHVWYHRQSKGQTVYVPPGFLTIEGLSSESSASIFSKRYFPKDSRCKFAYEGYKKLRENSKMDHERTGAILALHEKLP